jgi:cytidine deaminase
LDIAPDDCEKVMKMFPGATVSDRELIGAARRVRRYARAPYSGFRVGAALETREGVIVTGCNVENASYGLTMCAERVAIFKALSEGHRRFRRIVIAADTAGPTPPCGACRQVLWEYAGDLEVLLVGLRRSHGRYRLAELLPLPFDAALL